MKKETIRYNIGKQPAGYMLMLMSFSLFLGFVEAIQETWAMSVFSVLLTSVGLFFAGQMLIYKPTKCVFLEDRLVVRNYWFRREIPKEAIEQIHLNEKSVQIWWRESEKRPLKRESLPIESAEHFEVFSRHLPLITMETPDLPITLWVRWYWVLGLVPVAMYIGWVIYNNWSQNTLYPFASFVILIIMTLFFYFQRLVLRVTFDETHIEVVYLWRKRRFKRSLLSHIIVNPLTSVNNVPVLTSSQIELYFHGELEPIALSARFLVYDSLPITANFGYLPDYLANHYQVPLQIQGSKD